MKSVRQFPFDAARRVGAKEVETAPRAIEEKLGKKRRLRGRPPSGAAKYQAISIRLKPKAIAWAKKEGKRRGVGYQIVINEVLLKASA